MGIDIALHQKGLLKKKITLDLIKEAADSLEIATSDGTFRIKDYQDEPLTETTLLLYDSNLLSRGFTLSVASNEYDCELRQTYFCSDNDIQQFFDFLARFMKVLKLKDFEKDDEYQLLENIPQITEREIQFNRQTLHNLFKEENYPDTIYAVKNPVFIEPYVGEAILQMNEEQAMIYWSNYLQEKQNQDYYYAVPHFYQNQSGEIFGCYALTVNCYSVFPEEPFIPYGYDLKPEQISYYLVMVIQESEPYQAAQFPYEDLWKYFDRSVLKPYDQRHVYLELDSETLNRMKEDYKKAS